MQCLKVSPIKQIDAKYHRITRHDNQTIAAQNDFKYNYNKNKRSFYSRTTKQKLDIVEISAQGLNALKQHKQLTPLTQSDTTNTSYISRLIANYEK